MPGTSKLFTKQLLLIKFGLIVALICVWITMDSVQINPNQERRANSVDTREK